MNPSILLQWQYLIFLIPFGLSALLLLLSSLHFGHHGGHSAHGGSHVGHSAGHGHTAGTASGAGAHTSAAHSASHAANHHTTPGHASTPARVGNGGSQSREQNGAMHVQGVGGHLKLHLNAHPRTSHQAHAHNANPIATLWNLLMRLMGVGRAPMMMVLEVFFLAWGFSGYLAVKSLANNAEPSPSRVLTAVGIALVGGIVGARIAAEILGRILPDEESFVVSRDELYGLTGRVTFAVSASEGRVRIYDQHGTLHDEPCRVADGHPAIAKGQTVLIIDRDGEDNWIVEQVGAPAEVLR